MLLLTSASLAVHGLVMLFVPDVMVASGFISWLVAAVCYALAQVARHRVRLVGWLFTVGLQLTLMVYLLFGGGLEMGYALLFAVVSVEASLVLGWKEGILFSVWSVALCVWVFVMGSTDVLVFAGQDPRGVLLSTQLVGLFVLGVLPAFAVRHLYATLQESRARGLELHRTMEALREARAASDRLLRSMAEPVWVTDPDLRVISANDASLRILGLAAADVVGQHLTRWAELPNLRDRRQRGEGTLASVRGRIPVQVSRAEAGTAEDPRWVFVATDLSRRVEAEQRIVEAAKVAADANEAKSHFLANISHELRTPLNAIIGYSEMLLEEEPLGESRQDLGRIHGAGAHLLGLINDILDMSKIEAGEVEVHLEDVTLDDVLRECRDTVGPVAAANGTQLRVPETGRVFRSDRRKLAQILLNLLSNAAKFTVNGEVWIDVIDDEGGVRIDVGDSGRGIATSDMDRLFQPFRQLGEDAVIQPGTGLGLVLGQRLAELVGGRVTAASELGVGSTFSVWLPLEAEDAGALAHDGPLLGDVA